MKYITLAFIRVYQRLVAPLLPRACRFEPSCSHYGYEAISRYGILRGGWLAVKRVGRCQPLCSGGYDPVPDLLSQR